MKSPRLIPPSGVLARFPLDGRTISLGRELSCDVVLNGIGISRRHASIVLDPPNPRFMDNGSTFGTRLGESPVRDATLYNEAVITIGVTHMRVVLENGELSLIMLPPSGTPPAADAKTGPVQESVRPDLMRIGRDPANEIHCVHPLVSRFHASFARNAAGRRVITDHQSANGTYVNGVLIRHTQELREDDVVQVGPYRFYLEDDLLRQVDDYDRVKIEAFDLCVERGGRRILDGVSLSVAPGEFVAILGPSGAGKTTLGRVLTGSIQPDGGQVFMNGLPLRRFCNAFMSTIGYVSQNNVLHPELTVGETFHEHSILRLPGDSIPAERQQRIREVMELLEIAHLEKRQIRRLSGGEAKRVHLGIELLASPAVILLDEPLAGLDFSLIRTFMAMFRRICDKGHTVLLTTHTLEDIDRCDRLLFVNKGRVVFDGRPDTVAGKLGIAGIADLYDHARLKGAAVAAGSNVRPVPLAACSSAAPPLLRVRLRKSASPARQLPLLVARYLKVAIRNPGALGVIIVQVPLIALFLMCVFDRQTTFLPISFYFCITVSAIWIGGINAVREIAGEREIIGREYRAGLSMSAYGMAKVIVLTLQASLQSVLFWVLLAALFKPFAMNPQTLLLLGAATAGGVFLGMCVSSLSPSPAVAVGLLPVVLIPQFFFSGILISVDAMPLAGRVLSWLTVSRPVFSLFKKTCILELGIRSPDEWVALSSLMTGLIILSVIAMRLGVARNQNR